MELRSLKADSRLGALPLTEVWQTIKGVERYSSYFERRECIVARRGNAYEDRPYRQFWFLRKRLEGADDNPFDLAEAAVWMATVTFEEVRHDEAEHDYVATISVGRTTAYKKYRSSQHEVRFSLTGGRAGGVASDEQWAETFSHIRSTITRLDAIGESLDLWVESGLDMAVYCRGKLVCFRGAGRLTNAQLSRLRAQGSSLDDLRRKLICKDCGQRESKLLPA